MQQVSLLPDPVEDQTGEEWAFVPDYPDAELVFALVCAVGTDYKPVLEYLKDTIKLAGYAPNELKISEWFPEVADHLGLNLSLSNATEYDRISSRIEAGNIIRAETEQADVFALIAASKIYSTRERDDAKNPVAHKRNAHILVSLKRPEEVDTLRKIYGPGLFVIGIFADESQRSEYLTKRKGLDAGQANNLIQRDAKEKKEFYGQRTRDTFQMADLFVGLDGKQYEKGIGRFLELVFGNPFSTPTRDEHAMFLAYAASLRSGDLARQVGAALTCAGGDVMSLGCNDVPKPGGGLYSCDDGEADKRDFRDRGDQNDAHKAKIIDDIILAFRRKFLPGMTEQQILEQARPLLRETMVSEVTEFGRSVHAEMDALTAAGRIGVSFQDATLYTTTFPCHTCTRHIIAAGVKRVVYIEPYPKSLAPQLHQDAIRITATPRGGDDHRIPFEPFLGIGPRRFFDLFSLKLSAGYTIERKLDGEVVDWQFRRDARPRVPMAPTSYLEREQLIQKTLIHVFSSKKRRREDGASSGTATEERERFLEPSGGDGPAGRKLARLEDRRIGEVGGNVAAGDER
ncbi:MAG TPA: anti-phage dCTP deaminase [Bryobacteraceae bacterium]|nr:anti-phage dCTP deaminase [Bryobacteraceae bacterium]